MEKCKQLYILYNISKINVLILIILSIFASILPPNGRR